MNNHLYADYVYNDSSLLTDVNYGNGQSVHYAYNGFDQIATQQYRETPDSAYEMQFRYVYTDNAEYTENSTVYSENDTELFRRNYTATDNRNGKRYYSSERKYYSLKDFLRGSKGAKVLVCLLK